MKYVVISLPQFLENKSKYILIPQKPLLNYGQSVCAISVAPRFNKGGGPYRGIRGLSPQSPTDFCGFHVKIHSFQQTFLSKKDISVPPQ